MSSDLEALVAAGVDPDEAAAAIAAADALSERTASRTAELLAPMLAAGMIPATLAEAARGPLSRMNGAPWRQHSPIYLGPDCIEIRSNVYPDRIELELYANAEPAWRGTLRLG